MINLIHRFLTVILPCLLASGCAASSSYSTNPSSNVVPLVTTLEDGVADSQVVPIRLDNMHAWLALDTGAPFTFLFSDPAGPEYVDHAGTIEIGCEQWKVPGYRDKAIGVEMFQDRPILGVLGLDFFLDVPVEIDYPGGRLVRHLDRLLPAGDRRLPAVPMCGRACGRALIDVMLDDRKLTLMLDTGAHNTILIDVAGKEGDERTEVQTADGRTWEVYLGDAFLSLPGEDPRPVPVMRAEDLPYIAPELRENHAHGLFGLTSLGWRRVVFDFDAGVLRLGPLDNRHMTDKTLGNIK
jgi:hypothetical protein